jgi:NADP-dependent 3-hydroxy acid dehydrogenase YdfG
MPGAMKLQDKRVLITGGGSGIGLGVTELFAAEGANIVITGRSEERLETAKAGLGEAGERVSVRACDVSDRAQVADLVAWTEGRLGGIDILVNNAGVNVTDRSLAKVSPEDWQQMVDINLNGAFYCIHEVLPGMRARQDGYIINVSSIAGIRVYELAGVGYTASKYGMAALSLCAGVEERENGIRVCNICPGEVNTPIIDRRAEVMPPEVRAQILQPEDVAAAALFVATLPKRASVPELVITPTKNRFA